MRFAALIITLGLLVSVSTAQPSERTLSGPLVLTVNATQTELVLIEAETGNARTITVGEGQHTAWGFSADGCQVLVTLTDGLGFPKVYVAGLRDQSLQPLIRYDELPDSQWGVWEPTWSPDGSRIAFTMIRDDLDGEPGRQTHIGYVETIGAEPTFYSVSGREYSPAWSPDSAWLAYVSYDIRAPGVDGQSTAEPEAAENADPDSLLREAEVWAVAADASVKRRLTTYAIGSVRAPQWNPDGTRVAFIYSATPSNETLWVVGNTDNPIPLQVTYRFALFLGFRWTESDALWVSARDIKDGVPQGMWRIPVQAGADALITPLVDLTDAPAYPDTPTPSPDGRYLAYRSGYEVVVREVASGESRRLSEGIGNMPLYWSPAGFESEADCS